ncbi:MAG: transporter substrate-binding domain-containing protein [Pseudomonadota bacterium]
MVHLAGEEWPPFVSSALPGDGLSMSLVNAVYERLDSSAKVEYFPWKRTVELGLNSPRFAGFLAVWRTPERENLCYFSAPIANTVTVLAYLKEAPLRVVSLLDLKGLRIGTVAGYANGEQFDAMAAGGELTAEEGVNDDINLRKLLMRRFPAIVIEKHVLRHLLMSNQFTAAERERIGVVDNVFKERTVHVCFKRSAEGLLQQKQFNDAARAIDFNKFERDYWKRVGVDGNRAAGNF